MVFPLARRWKVKMWKLVIFTILGSLFIGEYLVYIVACMLWNVPRGTQDQGLTVMLISDPQILGFKLESPGIVGHVARWDAVHYLSKTFSYAMNKVNPNVVVFLGDLMDEGYIASDEEFLQYKKWFDDTYSVPMQVKTIHLAGDNDIGGENEPLDADFLLRHENHFGRTNAIVTFQNWQFLKLNTLSFLRYFQHTTLDERRIFENLGKFTMSSMQKLDNKKHTVVLSHLPLKYWEPSFAVQMLTKVKPRLIFSGHTHKAKDKVHETADFSAIEYTVPTCSYRMGTDDMGISVATLGSNGSFQYTVLKLPRRYPVLYFYIVVCVLLVFCLCYTYCLAGQERRVKRI